jgi:lipopolysaccharide/colanic/teichoic acid biosynthesis glycosyltransferase
MEKMIRRMYMDLDYLEKRSFALDIKIIWLTTWSIISGKKF